MNPITTLTWTAGTVKAVFEDGTTSVLFPVPTPVAPVAPTITEVDVKESDGTNEPFVPETPTPVVEPTPTVTP
jgi:hypothetical protein